MTKELANLKTMLAQMGGLAEDAWSPRPSRRWLTRDTKLAHIVIARTRRSTPRSASSRSGHPHHRQAPADGADLREIMVAIRIASDLERIGDLAKNIAKRVARHRRR
jgi:phosphate transport system protein